MGVLHSGGHPTRGILFGAGAASGFMATAAGLGGPPVALIYQRETGVRLRGTLAAYFIVGTVLSLIALAWAGRFGTDEMRMSVWLIPGTVIGYFLSRPAAAYLDGGRTRIAVLTVSALAAVSVIVTVLCEAESGDQSQEISLKRFLISYSPVLALNSRSGRGARRHAR